MKKKAIILLAFAVALAAVSCQKEAMKEAETTPTGEGMTISAVSEGIGAETKAAMVYKYDVVWKTGDKICVKNSEKSVEFTLTGGEETTKGTFSSGESISGDVEGFYPSSIVTDGGLVWPAEQGSKQICPMYCKKNLTSTQNQTFNFNSLGSVLQLAFNSTTDNITVKSIKVSANEAMSGAFTINEGKAVISQPEGDKPGITLDLGEGVAMGTSAKYFNIAIPSGTYSALSIVLTATDGQICTINAKKPIAIEHNMVYKLTISGEFKADVPAGALPGVFTVSPEGKKVHFSQGNIQATYNSSASTYAWGFAANQYDFIGNAAGNTTIDSQTNGAVVDLFGWSTSTNGGTSTTDNYGIKTSTNNSDYSGDFYDWGKAVGDGSTWRTLSKDEWTYLFNNHSKKWATVNGVNGYVIAPDGFEGTLPDSYADDAALAAAGNLVFLPAAGYRYGSDVFTVGASGFYWSSSDCDSDLANCMYFTMNGVIPDNTGSRSVGYSVRLVTEVN